MDKVLHEAEETLTNLSEKTMTLHQLSKLLIEAEVTQQPETVPSKLSTLLPHAVLNDITYEDLQRKVEAIEKSQHFLKVTLKDTLQKVEQVHHIQAVSKKKEE